MFHCHFVTPRLLIALVILLFTTHCSQESSVQESFINGKVKKEKVYRKNFFSSQKKWVKTREYHISSQLKYEAEIKNGQYHGQYTSWWYKGKIKAQGNYSKGKKEGHWKFFHQKSGALYKEGKYHHDKMEGPWTLYWPSGNKQSQGEYKGGKKRASWNHWDEVRNLMLTSSCFASNPEGIYKSYYYHGKRKELYTCRWGNKSGLYTLFHPNELAWEKGEYDSIGLKQGLWEKHFIDGKLKSKETYESGLRHGSLKTWDKKGSIIQSGEFIKGTGTLKSFNHKGKLSGKESFKEGKKEGPKWTFYPQGYPRSKMLFKNDTLISSTLWHPALGKKQLISREGHFKKGKRQGLWKWYNKKGLLIESAHYKNGMREGESKHFDVNTGKLLRTQIYEKGMPKKAILAPK